jgi:hypothetical protein
MSDVAAVSDVVGRLLDLLKLDPVRRRDRLVRRRGRLVLRLLGRHELPAFRRDKIRQRIITLDERISRLDLAIGKNRP